MCQQTLERTTLLIVRQPRRYLCTGRPCHRLCFLSLCLRQCDAICDRQVISHSLVSHEYRSLRLVRKVCMLTPAIFVQAKNDAVSHVCEGVPLDVAQPDASLL